MQPAPPGLKGPDNRNMTRSFPFILVTGGCRCGKSLYAQKLAESFSQHCLYVATARARDEEMRTRIRLHQETRGERWKTLELPPGDDGQQLKNLPETVIPGESLLFDCLTLWAAGCMRDDRSPEDFPERCADLLDTLWALLCPVIIVTNEVGMGVVPSSAAGRAFRDMAGFSGQRAAELADPVILMISGIPLAIKGRLPLIQGP